MASLDRPNILLVVFDSLSTAAFSGLKDTLPVLSGLRNASAYFPNTYVCSPEAGPARVSLFTGLDMAAHGVWTDGVALPERERTLSQHFAGCGYRSWLVGRRHLAGVSHWTTEHARPSEYAAFEWAHGPLHQSRQNAYLAWLQETAPETYSEIFPMQADPDATGLPAGQGAAMAALPDDLSFNAWVGARTVAQIAKEQGVQPFFGVAGFVVGAAMGGEPVACEALMERALLQADAALGSVLQCLEQGGLAEDTIIVVTAGRGRGAGRQMQDSATKVPLMICAPGRNAREIETPVSTMDVAPTLYDLAKMPTPLRLQGTPLMAGMAGRGWALSRLRNPDCAWQTALVSDRWKLVVTHGQRDRGVDPVYALYDLVADPNEAKDLARVPAYTRDLEDMIDLMIDARVALEDRTEPRVAKF